MKKYILIAGVNGAGKSTLFQSLDSLQDMPRINTDEIVRSFGDWRSFSDVVKAGKIAVKKIDKYFQDGETFNQETTLCGVSILRNIEKAKSLGYEIELHFVGLESVTIAKERIAYRISHGGHGIPDKDVERRYEESFRRLFSLIPMCDTVVLYDNTEVFRRFAIYENGKLLRVQEPFPDWFKNICNSV